MRTSLLALLGSLGFIACSDSPFPASPTDEAPARAAPVSSGEYAFGPVKFVRRREDRIAVPFSAVAGSCTLSAEDDQDPATVASVWLNGAVVLDRSALLGPPSVVSVPVILQDENALEVAVRGGREHFVTIWIECGPRVVVVPRQATVYPGQTQQFAVQGSAGPFTWSVNGEDGGGPVFGTIDGNGEYLAPAQVPAPATFGVCVRVTLDPALADCAEVTVLPPPVPTMVVIAGDAQVGVAGRPVGTAPAVLVSHADGSPWPGVSVTFAVTGGGGSITGGSAATGPDGVATLGSWILGPDPGPNTLSATALEPGISGSPAVFTAVGFQPDARTVAAGHYHSCALDDDGGSICWGENTYGQLGDGTTTQRLTAVPAAGGHTFVSISVGHFFSCGLTPEGTAFCWGANESGQLGDGTTTSRPEPVMVAGGITFASLDLGAAYACGLTPDGTAWCWGQNNFGQLGSGGFGYKAQPTRVSTVLKFRSLAAGLNHTCALTSEKAAWCWGYNYQGELGDGTTTLRVLPVEVLGGISFKHIDAGRWYTCGTDQADQAWCWGHNWAYQLGTGDTLRRLMPDRVIGGLTYPSLITGEVTPCGITPGGAGYCWGYNGFNAAGTGNDILYLTAPTPISGGLLFVELAGGLGHTCGRTTTNELYCWGENTRGQVGDGTVSSRRKVPTRVIQ